MSQATEIIKEAYKTHKGIILFLLEADNKTYSELAVHLKYTSDLKMFSLGFEESRHHFYGEIELEASGKTENLKVSLKDNPRIKVDVHGFYINQSVINKKSKPYAFILPVLTKNDEEAEQYVRQMERKENN